MEGLLMTALEGALSHCSSGGGGGAGGSFQSHLSKQARGGTPTVLTGI